jgi:hypothetical protein
MKQEIRDRWSGEIKFTAEIEANPTMPLGVRIGLAVKWAIKTGTNLTGANLTGADLYGANLTGADLTGADLYGANLTGTNLTGADLTGADLTGTNLTGANLTGANLTGANLTGADLYGANLTGADLTGADLTGTNLTGANLTGANLTGADLYGAKVHGEEIKRLIASASRSDGYVFYAFEMMAGGVKIMAGCRWFTPKEYRIHIRTEYPDTDKGVETEHILDLIEGRMADLGIVTKEIA